MKNRRTKGSPAGRRRGPSEQQPEPVHRPGSDRFEVAIAGGLGVLAFVHRWLFLSGGKDRDWPFSIFYFGDTRIFFEQALSLLRGVAPDEGIPLRPPLFPRLLALVYRWVGADPATSTVPHFDVRLLLAALASLGIALMYLVLRPYLGRWLGVAATLPWVWHFGGYVVAVAPVVEGTYFAALMAVLLVLTRRIPSRLSVAEGGAGWGWAVVLGLGLGGLHLLRAESVLLGALVLGLCLLPHGAANGRQRYSVSGLVVLGWLSALVPSTWVNHQALEAANQRMTLAEPLPVWVPVSLYGRLNLALANSPSADGRFSPVLLEQYGARGSLELENPRQLDLVLHGDRAVWRFVRAQPQAFVALVGARIALAGRVAHLGWGARDWPGGLRGAREPVDMFIPDRRVAGYVWLPFALVGLWACWRAGAGPRRWLGLVALVSVAPWASVLVFFGYARLLILALPLWLSLAGIGAVTLTAGFGGGYRWSSVRALRVFEGGRPGRVAVGVLGAAVVLLVVADAAASRRPVDFTASGSADARGTIIQDAAVRLEPKPALSPLR